MLDRIRKTAALVPLQRLRRQAAPVLDEVRVRIIREEPDMPADAAALFCGKCGTKVAGVVFCVRCGARVAMPEKPSRFARLLRRLPKVTRQDAVVIHRPPEPAKKKKGCSHIRTFVWGAVTGAIVLTALLLYAAFHMLHIAVRL